MFPHGVERSKSSKKKGNGMKKMILLFTLTLVSAGVLNGMREENYWQYLPQDVQRVIIKTALERSMGLDAVIETIEALSTIQGVRYDNLKNFTALVHILADIFNKETEIVAKKFNLQIANKYIALGDTLKAYAYYPQHLATLVQLINEGADVNYSTFPFMTPLESAISGLNIEGVDLLLNAGAKLTDRGLNRVGATMHNHPYLKQKKSIIIKSAQSTGGVD